MGNKRSLKPQLQKWRRQDGSNFKKPLAAEIKVDLTLMWSVVEVAPMTQQITDPLSTLIASNDFLNHLLKGKSLKTASNLMLKLFYSWARQFDISFFPMRRTWSLVGKCVSPLRCKQMCKELLGEPPEQLKMVLKLNLFLRWIWGINEKYFCVGLNPNNEVVGLLQIWPNQERHVPPHSG